MFSMLASCGANILIVMGFFTIGYCPTGVKSSLAVGALPVEASPAGVPDSVLQALKTREKQSATPTKPVYD
ncbi:hypothetical protein PAENIP36_25360 [Paenibacillus sp. P36]